MADPELGLAHRVVVVTGASSGIGAATLQRCVERGATGVGFDISSPPGEGRLDVADEDAVRQAMAATMDTYGRIDAVVHAAGVVGDAQSGVDELDRADWDHVISTNLTGTWLVAKHSLPLLEKTSGSLLMVGSGAGVHNAHTSVAYAVSKAGVSGLWTTLEETWRRRGVNVLNLLVGSVDTPLARRYGAGEEFCAARKAENMMLEPGEVAELIAFLVSPAARAIRGGVRTW